MTRASSLVGVAIALFLAPSTSAIAAPKPPGGSTAPASGVRAQSGR